MNNEKILERAKELSAMEMSRLSGKAINVEDCYVVWFCKTLQNWKALVSTSKINSASGYGDYVEVTHNGDKGEAYVDVYSKVLNRAIAD